MVSGALYSLVYILSVKCLLVQQAFPKSTILIDKFLSRLIFVWSFQLIKILIIFLTLKYIMFHHQFLKIQNHHFLLLISNHYHHHHYLNHYYLCFKFFSFLWLLFLFLFKDFYVYVNDEFLLNFINLLLFNAIM